MYSVYNVLGTVLNLQCVKCVGYCIECIVQCVGYCVECIVYNVLGTVLNVQYTVC